jgi:ABC-2 type transport system ATP-binding protein
MSSAISLRGVTKSYRSSWTLRRASVLHGLDLEVEEGKIFGFLGPNGAGKTTTIKILVGLARASGGSTTVLGQPAGTPAARHKVGFLPENPYFYEYLTSEESLRFYASLFGLPRAERGPLVERLLADFDLARVRHQRIRTFSKGMRQRLGMAQALVGNPRLVILDEPQSGLDPIGRYHIKAAIARLREQGVTVFFSSHILADVEDLCDDVGLLVAGRLAQTGPLHDLLAAQSQSHELQFREVGPEAARQLAEKGIHGTHSGGVYTIQTSRQDEIGAVLDCVRSVGGRVVSVQPMRESLEDYFVRMAQGNGNE